MTQELSLGRELTSVGYYARGLFVAREELTFLRHIPLEEGA